MSYLMKDLPMMEKPREKAYQYGVESLSDAELLAVLLRTGLKSRSVVEVSFDLLGELGDIRELKRASFAKLSSINGIGKVKALTLLSAVELGNRVYRIEKPVQLQIKETGDIYRYYHEELDEEMQEKFFVLFLNSKNYVLGRKVLFIGTANQSLVHPRDIFREAILQNAVKIICVHNHPSGNPAPSQADTFFTEQLCASGKLIGIPLLDHIILGKDHYYSFLEHGKVEKI